MTRRRGQPDRMYLNGPVASAEITMTSYELGKAQSWGCRSDKLRTASNEQRSCTLGLSDFLSCWLHLGLISGSKISSHTAQANPVYKP